MPRINTLPKLDFNQVLIEPKRSNLNSRSEVELERTFSFSNGQTWTGVPIIAANMATTGTFEMYKELQKHKMLTALHKFYDADDYKQFSYQCELHGDTFDPDFYMVSTGISDSDFEKLVRISQVVTVKWICIDIANGYIPNMLTFCQRVRASFPGAILVGGNIATPDMVTTLCIEGGIDVIKCGIGPGCLQSGTQILMKNNKTGKQGRDVFKAIEEIEIGDEVINMYGNPVKVTNVWNRGQKRVMKLKTAYYNECLTLTPDHELYVFDDLRDEFRWKCAIDVDIDHDFVLCPCNLSENYTPDAGDYKERFILHSIVQKLVLNEEAETWDIEVDCPTHSFVANNTIVHNSACTTRLKTGVGMPQLSCIMECADAAHGIGKFIVGDGGITSPGDLSKAFCGGADFVMMGGVFAGHDENPGELIEKPSADGTTQKFKLFYGMSSTHAMLTHYGKKNSYRASEGKVVEVPYKGKLIDTIEDYLGGVRSTCTYIGAKCIKHMPKCTTFVLVGQQLNTIFK